MDKEIDLKELQRNGNIFLVFIMVIFIAPMIVIMIFGMEISVTIVFMSAIISAIMIMNYVMAVVYQMEKKISRLENIIQNSSRNS